MEIQPISNIDIRMELRDKPPKAIEPVEVKDDSDEFAELMVLACRIDLMA